MSKPKSKDETKEADVMDTDVNPKQQWDSRGVYYFMMQMTKPDLSGAQYDELKETMKAMTAKDRLQFESHLIDACFKLLKTTKHTQSGRDASAKRQRIYLAIFNLSQEGFNAVAMFFEWIARMKETGQPDFESYMLVIGCDRGDCHGR